jgi:hypothetical protein
MAFNVFLAPTSSLAFGDCAVGQRAFRSVGVLVTKSIEDPQTSVTVSIDIAPPIGTTLAPLDDGPGGWQGNGPFTRVLTFDGNQAEATLPLLYQVLLGGGADVGVTISATVTATTIPAGAPDSMTCTITPVEPIERAIAADLVVDVTHSLGTAGLQRIKNACQRVLPLAAAANLLTPKDWLGMLVVTRTASAGYRRVGDMHMCTPVHINGVLSEVNALTLDPQDVDGNGLPDEGTNNKLVNAVRSSWASLGGICDCAPQPGKRAVIVFTDGSETTTTSKVPTAAKVFPIGVPGNDAPNVSMLNWIARGATPLVLTGDPTSGSDSAFFLDKYLLQALASLFGTSIALDPDGFAPVDGDVSIPFWITSADSEVSALLLTEDAESLEVELVAPELPHGHAHGPGRAAVEPRRLPEGGTGTDLQLAEAEKRTALARPALAVNFARHRAASRVYGKGFTALAFNRMRSAGNDQQQELTRRNGQWTVRIRSKSAALERSHGAPKNPYSLVVLTRSDLKFSAELAQDGCSVGATAFISALLTEAGAPIGPERARVYALIQFPDGGTGTLRLNHAFGTRYEAEFRCTQIGTYRVHIQADGLTFHKERFHRETTAFANVDAPACLDQRHAVEPALPAPAKSSPKPCGCK